MSIRFNQPNFLNLQTFNKKLFPTVQIILNCSTR